MVEFGTSVEDKFKLSLLSIEKRFVELEGAIGDIQQKLQNVQATDTNDLEQRISDLEDLIYVEQGGIEELKGMLENQHEERQQEQPRISAEEVQKIVDPIVASAKNDLQNRIQQLRNQPNVQNEITKKINQLEGQLQALHHFRAELDILKNKVEPLNAETIRSIVAEISDLRIETGREVRELKEKVGNAPLYADIQFLSNRVKDLKMTMDNLLNMKVEIDAKILNMERNMAEGAGGSTTVASNLISEVEDTKKQLFSTQKRISSLDGMVKDFMKTMGEKGVDTAKQIEMTREIEVLYSKMNELYSDVERKALEMNRLAPVNFNDRISELNAKISRLEEELRHAPKKQTAPAFYDDQLKQFLEKIILLETRVNVLETNISEPRRLEPIILE